MNSQHPIDLYRLAEEQGTEVDWFPMAQADSLSVALPDGSCCVAIDPWKMRTVREETVALAHELGHCCTGSFYNEWTAFGVMEQHENRADKWAIRKLVPAEELERAVQEGRTELWELAELFDVTEDFMRKALCWYRNGSLGCQRPAPALC